MRPQKGRAGWGAVGRHPGVGLKGPRDPPGGQGASWLLPSARNSASEVTPLGQVAPIGEGGQGESSPGAGLECHPACCCLVTSFQQPQEGGGMHSPLHR